MNDTHGLSPRQEQQQRQRQRQPQQQRQQHQQLGLPPGKDSHDEDNTDWDDSVRFISLSAA